MLNLLITEFRYVHKKKNTELLDLLLDDDSEDDRAKPGLLDVYY